MCATDQPSIHVRDRQTIDEPKTLALRCQSPLGFFLPQLSYSFFGHKHEVVCDQRGAQLNSILFSLVGVLDFMDFDDQRVLDAENRIGRLVWIVLEVQSTVV